MSILAGERFELKLIRIPDVLLHEECEDNRSSRLIERFNSEKVLYNPLIVAKYKNKHILIDGANRFEALKKLECKIILAQLVNYDNTQVKLKSWFHYVNRMSMVDLEKYLKKNKIDFSSCSTVKRPGDINQLVVISSSNEAISIILPAKLPEMLEVLTSLNRYYENGFSYMRIDSDTDVSNITDLSPEEGLLFIYPEFKKEHIVAISGIKQKLPAGITRHLIPNRVLHIKILVEALKTDEHFDKRNDDLEKFIQYKIDTKKVRLYREPILIFDE